nr:triple tyrosine motif-containing protein [uncultured Flavobacterium sp.]
MTSKIIRFLLFYFFLLSPSTKSQTNTIGLPEIKNYNRFDYSAGTQNWAIDQDRNGNMYFANNDGLLQFDGTTWRLYRTPNKSIIRSVKIDKKGRIHIAGYQEFGYFEPTVKGKLAYHSLYQHLKKKGIIEKDIVWKVHVLQEEIIYQSFSQLYIYKNNHVRTLASKNRFQFSYIVNGHLYVQDIKQGLMEYKNGRLYLLPHTENLINKEIWGIFSFPKNKLLISTMNDGLYQYHSQQLKQWKTEANSYTLSNNCLGGVILNQNQLVLNTILNGCFVIDTTGKIIQKINQNKELQNNTVLSSFKDRNNNLWLGLDNGITFVHKNSPFTYFKSSYDLSTVYASVLYRNNIYVATSKGVYYHPFKAQSNVTPFKLIPNTIGQTWNLQVIDNQLFCASNIGALVINSKHEVRNLKQFGFFGFKAVPLQPNIVIGNAYNSYSVFEKINQQWRFKNNIQGLDLNSDHFELDRKILWFVKDKVLYRCTLVSDFSRCSSIKSYKKLPQMPIGVTSVQKIKNKICFQVQNVFFTYNYSKQQFEKEPILSKLFHKIPKVSVIKEDAFGNLWYRYNESLGVMFFKNSQYKNEVASFANITKELSFNHTPINAISSNQFFIGLSDGLAYFNYPSHQKYVTSPQAFIRNFISKSDTLVLQNGQKKIKISPLPFSSNHVQFSFSSPTYENLENVEYSYKLDGFDKKWSNWSRNYSKEYTNLHEGDYIMKVKVRNSYGIVSKSSQLEFTIRPPWYRHYLAYTFYIALLLIISYNLHRSVKLKIRKNKYKETIEQRRLYIEKEAKIKHEQVLLEREIVKLKNDKLKIKIVAKDKELVSNSLQVVKKNKILNGILVKLKEINTPNVDETLKIQLNKLQKFIIKEVNSDKSNSELEKHIQNVHFDFLKRLKEQFPSITPRESDLATYLLMNLSTKEIAEITNISIGGVELARYRLRKKLNLDKKQSLTSFLTKI